jgi:hypothetical protein
VACAVIANIDTGVDLGHDLHVIAGHDYVDDDDIPLRDSNGTTGTAPPRRATPRSATTARRDRGRLRRGRIRLGGATSMSDLYDAFVGRRRRRVGAVELVGYSDGCPEVPLYGIEQDALDTRRPSAAGFDRSSCSARGTAAATSATSSRTRPCRGERDRRYGPRWYSSYGEHVDIAAPRGSTTDLVGDVGYGAWEGTPPTRGCSRHECLVPVVAGTVALMLSANPRLTAADVRAVPCATAERMDLVDAEWIRPGAAVLRLRPRRCRRRGVGHRRRGRTRRAGARVARGRNVRGPRGARWRTSPTASRRDLVGRRPALVETEATSIDLTTAWRGDVSGHHRASLSGRPPAASRAGDPRPRSPSRRAAARRRADQAAWVDVSLASPLVGRKEQAYSFCSTHRIGRVRRKRA